MSAISLRFDGQVSAGKHKKGRAKENLVYSHAAYLLEWTQFAPKPYLHGKIDKENYSHY